MSFHLLPCAHDFRNALPVTQEQARFIAASRQSIAQVLDNNDSRFLLIVGPCSIHDLTGAKEYACKLKELADSVSDLFCVVMRCFFEKSRTLNGWKGLLYDPLLNGSHRLDIGMRWVRELLLEITAQGIPTACEFLEPISASYFEDLISWGCIGARTATSQIHRQLASGLPMPIGFKNTLDGSLEQAVNGAQAARSEHTFFRMHDKGFPAMHSTEGNSHAHIVLRGGETGPNYDPLSISRAVALLQRADLSESLLIDCSHGNSGKNDSQQARVFESSVNEVIEGTNAVKGFMLESYLQAGNQPLGHDPSRLKYGISITDPCLDWETTERLIKWGYQKLKKYRSEIAKQSCHVSSFG